MSQIELTDAQRLEIKKRCLEAVKATEGIFDDMLPRTGLRDDLIGNGKDRWIMVGASTGAGILVLVVWRWLFDSLGISTLLLGVGLPAFLVHNTPEILAFLATAVTGMAAAHTWGVEGRVRYATCWFNAHQRAATISSVLDELSDILPGAVPDLSEYDQNWDDDAPNTLIERAIGRSRDSKKKPTLRHRRQH